MVEYRVILCYIIDAYACRKKGWSSSWTIPQKQWTKSLPFAKTEASFFPALKFTAVLPTHGTTALWVLSSRTTSKRLGGKSLFRSANTTWDLTAPSS